MERDPKVFSSNIIRSAKPLKNDLTDLLKTVPAQPVIQRKYEKRLTSDFQPRLNKHFEPKKRTKFKVKTVRNIRNEFEKDINTSLPIELEKQQNILLRKIRAGSSREENTKSLAKNILKSDKPISRSAWQMLMNLNPEERIYSTQFVLWNGNRIQVNGSKGGKCKFICKYDLGAKNVSPKTSVFKGRSLRKRRGLLQNSLSINFKPGPLTKKKFLDNSYQKYHVGETELLHLPKPGLEIQPTLGKVVDPTIACCLHNIREEEGTISNKWAEFSVSVLATVKNDNIVQTVQESCVTFDLSYKSTQRQILMRRDLSSDFQTVPLSNNVIENFTVTPNNSNTVTTEIKNLLHEMLNSVEISVEQDNMFTGEDEPRKMESEESNTIAAIVPVKDRLKRKCIELERLDVTIIRLSENADTNSKNFCHKASCALGCVCASLECAFNLKRHCGRIECMFECKCDFSTYKVVDSLERDFSEFIPGLLNKDKEIISKMAKEEQKFHQTVIITSENSMLLKSNRRNWKSSKKYADFYSNMCLKTDSKSDRVSAVVLEKLNLNNVEPWCMIHSLYKCFCKGKFTDNWVPDVIADETKPRDVVEQNDLICTENATENVENNSKNDFKYISSYNMKPDKNYIFAKKNYSGNMQYETDYIDDCQSARIKPFKGRKYSDDYYFNANIKIIELEKHDKTLRNRMINLINISVNNSSPQNVKEPVSEEACESSSPLLVVAPSQVKASDSNIKLFTKKMPDKTKLVAWLETSYKHYKQRVDQGIVKVSLDPPKLGKLALYPWEFILSRYREQKNLFLISKQPQYRIFMAVDTKHPFFDSCININDIRFADLHKYPITVKNLLTNEKDLKDNFCILCGLSHCWELIGSVTKLCEQQQNKKGSELNTEDEKNDVPEAASDVFKIDSEKSSAVLDQDQDQEATENDDETESESSKWFVMTVENDFNEIQFYKKGFFVKLESITKAINVARASGKTVRLSSQKCVDNTGPQFGIYAIPNQKESCVFVGPYEKDESLGIETVKNIFDHQKQKRTRGVWITTKKLENFKVIDNPLSFMPSKNTLATDMMTLAGDSSSDDKTTDFSRQMNNLKEGVTQVPKRKEKSIIYKPIKIRKSNEFYHLAPNGTLKPISAQQIQLNSQIPVFNDGAPKIVNTTLTKISENSVPSNAPSSIPPPTIITFHKKPVAEIAPHVKAKSHYPRNILPPTGSFTRKEKGMFILKPEEINKRLLQNQMPSSSNRSSSQAPKSKITNDQELDMDIENFLATAEECVAPNDDVFIVSDDETDLDNVVNTSQIERWQKVWIECKTVEDLGWIPGRVNKQKFLSFEFPGFKFTEFYKTDDAFNKLNQVLSRKIYIPRHIHLEWHVVESEQGLKTKHMLKAEELGPDFVMTKRGILHKQHLASGKFLMKNHASGSIVYELGDERNDEGSDAFLERPKESIKDLEATSLLLEDESEFLWNQLKSSSASFELDDHREEVAARLQRMVSDT